MRKNAYLFNGLCSMIHVSTNSGEGEAGEVVQVGVSPTLSDNTEIEAGLGNTNTVGPGLLSALTQHNFSKKISSRNLDPYSQCANVESNKTISEKKTTVTASMFNTYRVRNHFVPNPTNSKLVRLKIKKI